MAATRKVVTDLDMGSESRITNLLDAVANQEPATLLQLYTDVAKISGRTEDTAPDGAADFLLAYDASAAVLKKILLHRATAFKVGTFTRNTATASGSVPYTGIGFKPKFAIFLMGLPGGGNKVSLGFDDGVTAACVANYNPGGAGFWLSQTTQSIEAVHTTSDLMFGKVASFDSDGFTMAYIKVGSPVDTVDVIYIVAR